jgi:hypothetical protein
MRKSSTKIVLNIDIRVYLPTRMLINPYVWMNPGNQNCYGLTNKSTMGRVGSRIGLLLILQSVCCRFVNCIHRLNRLDTHLFAINETNAELKYFKKAGSLR